MKPYNPGRRQADAWRVDDVQGYHGFRTANRTARKLKKAARQENKRREREDRDEDDDWR